VHIRLNYPTNIKLNKGYITAYTNEAWTHFFQYSSKQCSLHLPQGPWTST
jgi:hypothetical protein